MKKSITNLLIYVISAQLIGVLSNLASKNTKEVYGSLIKPPLSPPNIVFAIVWPILFLLMSISAYMVSTADVLNENKKIPLTLYYLQLAINFFWSITFFRFQAMGASIIVIILLLFTVSMMAISFYKIKPLAGIINLPYILWVAFATYINIGIYALN